ncbi:MAG: type III secretion protein [Phycisphaerales bacterium]|nr:type III secretion protein [Phycisphaerales bacterium]
MSSLEQLSQHLLPAILVISRIGGLALHGPVLSSPAIPMQIKAFLVVALGLSCYPAIAAGTTFPPDGGLLLATAFIAGELLIGAVIGFLAAAPILAMQFGGVFMGQQIGLGFARFYNPAIDEESDAVEQILFFLALGVFISIGGLEAMFGAVLGSFATIPPGTAFTLITGTEGTSLAELAIGTLTIALELGLRVSAPLFAIVFLETVAMGFLSRSVPQLNVMTIGFPVRLFIGCTAILGGLASIHEALLSGTDAALARLFAFGGAHG